MKFLRLLLVLSVFSVVAWAHPMPNSVMQFDIRSNGVLADLRWPLKELQLVFPNEDIDKHPSTLLARKQAWLDSYLLAHIRVTDSAGRRWSIQITGHSETQTQQNFTGPYAEVIFTLWLQPPSGASPRHFRMDYDAIMHQVVTHKVLIKIVNDWDGGMSGKDNTEGDLGVLMVHVVDNTVPPLIVNLDEGSKWKGFKNMVALGMCHISEGTDHLLFLMVLMLPAPLIAIGGKWGKTGGTKYSAVRLLKIATAFTIGHSITLLAGAIGWLRLPSQPVEIMISISIITGAAHALKPIFPGREIFIAAGFGLIHGLAFASTIAALNVDGIRMALSILGFNVGIELMQLFIIILFVPWLVILSNYGIYKWIRVIGALFGSIAASGWIMERLSGKSNKITTSVQSMATHGQWVVLFLAVLSLIMYFFRSPDKGNG